MGFSAGCRSDNLRPLIVARSNAEASPGHKAFATRNRIYNSTSGRRIHFILLPRTRTPVRHCGPGLMRDEVREKVGQNSEQRQSGNAVCGQNPRSAAFMLPDGGSSSRGLLGIRRRDDRGPIFHAKTSDGKIVAQVRYASRPPRIVAKQEYLSAILPRIRALAAQKCDRDHGINMQI